MTPESELSGEFDVKAGASAGVVRGAAAGAETGAAIGPVIGLAVGPAPGPDMGAVRGSRAEGTGVGKGRTILFVGRLTGAGDWSDVSGAAETTTVGVCVGWAAKAALKSALVEAAGGTAFAGTSLTGTRSELTTSLVPSDVATCTTGSGCCASLLPLEIVRSPSNPPAAIGKAAATHPCNAKPEPKTKAVVASLLRRVFRRSFDIYASPYASSRVRTVRNSIFLS